MKTYFFLLILAAFLQASFLPLNLVLMLLICRSLVLPGKKENLILAFAAGILLSLLQSQNIGFWALVFLLVVRGVALTKKLPVSKNLLTVLSVSIITITLVTLTQQLFFKQSFDPKLVLFESVLILPLYLIMLFWEERFEVRPEIKLKLRG